MALPFWCSFSLMTLPSEAPALPPPQEKTYLPLGLKGLKSNRSWRLIRFSFVAGVGINFKPVDSRLICLSVSCSFDILLMYFLRDSMALRKLFIPFSNLRSFLLRFFIALVLFLFVFPFPRSSEDSENSAVFASTIKLSTSAIGLEFLG